jgi:hypothetical protein
MPYPRSPNAIMRLLLWFIDWLNERSRATYSKGGWIITKEGNRHRECPEHKGVVSWNGAKCPYCEDENCDGDKPKRSDEQMATLGELFEGYEDELSIEEDYEQRSIKSWKDIPPAYRAILLPWDLQYKKDTIDIDDQTQSEESQ